MGVRPEGADVHFQELSARNSIDHTVGGHDDITNAVVGALLLGKARQPMRFNDEVLTQFAAPVMRGPVW